ncbi:MAG: hypothetical protein ACI8S7_001550, partial [Candidatus Krumholzibacteriia bacterium]
QRCRCLLNAKMNHWSYSFEVDGEVIGCITSKRKEP